MLHSTLAPATVAVVDFDEVQTMLQDESDFGMSQLSLLVQAVNRQQASDVRRATQELRTVVDSTNTPSQGALVRLGVALHLLGSHRDAKVYLSRVEAHPIASFYLGHVGVALDQPDVAAAEFQAAAQAGHDAVDCELQRVTALRLAGKVDEAESALKAIETTPLKMPQPFSRTRSRMGTST